MANSAPIFKLFKIYSVIIMIVVGFYGCQWDEKTASVDKKEAPAKVQLSKPDTVLKYVRGPGMPAVSCCKGFPSRGKALAAKK